MPTYHYECRKEGGGCGQDWHDFKSISGRYHVMCPNCSTDGMETYFDQELGRVLHKVEMLFDKAPAMMHDIDFQDGRLGESVAMPSLGPNVRVGSRRELKDALQRARDHMFEATEGEHSTMVPIKQDDGTYVMEKFTSHRNGTDIGEIVPVDKLPEIINDPVDQATGKKYRDIELAVRRRLGEVSPETEPAIFEKRMATPDPPGELPAPKLNRKDGRSK